MSRSIHNAPAENAQNVVVHESTANAGGEVRAVGILGAISWFYRIVTSTIGPVLVLAAFAMIFLYGHNNDWRLPKFAVLGGSTETAVADWCEEHGVPESICVECDPTLMPRGPDYGWCAEHGVHNCPLHHPDVAELKATTAVPASDFERASRALATADRLKNNSSCKVYKSRIQFESVESVQQAGVDVELVERRPIVESLSGNGEIVYDPTRMASLASRAPGSVWSVEKNVGDKVQKGDVLALIDATETGELKTQLLSLLAEEKLQQQTLSRLKTLRGGIVAGSRILDAEAAFTKAQADVLSAEQSLLNLGLPVQVSALRQMDPHTALNQLRLLGIPSPLRSKVEKATSSANLLPVISPITGVIVDRTVTAGEVVDPTRVLFKVADLDQMWLQLNLPLEKLDYLTIGQPIRFRADGSNNEITGRLNWISTTADSKTRMVQVRAVLPNPHGKLRNETYGAGEVILREEKDAIVIPSGSSHWEGCCQIVFVRGKNYFDSPETPKVFHVRSVRLGESLDGYTEVISGVLPGEVIATAGSDVLRAQLLKNNLGAGCDCVAE